MSNSPDDAPEIEPTPAWWITDFAGGLAKFNHGAKVMGDHGLPPAIRSLLLENEECQHRETSGLPPKRVPK
jgi:hypothetical protein